MSADRLFQPLKLGRLDLKHRMVLAPLTRVRADASHIPSEHAKTYYSQRGSIPGTFMVTEGTLVSLRAAGAKHIPGIWSNEQVKAWKEVTDAVHAKDSYIFLQIAALGRTASESVLQEEGGYHVVSSSAFALEASQSMTGVAGATPVAMTEDVIQLFIDDFAQAARNAIEAGFDGVEIHGANGYLVDQFWQDRVNQRTDRYGGSVENRARFGLELTKAVIEAIGDSKKVAMRLSPWSDFQGMGSSDPLAQFLYITRELKKLDLAYLHLVESRTSSAHEDVSRENEPFVKAWGTESPILLAGGFTPKNANRTLTEVYPDGNVLIVFGRYFLSTPDLAYRLFRGLEVNAYDRTTFYSPGPKGYIDYPFSKEYLEEHSRCENKAGIESMASALEVEA